MTDTEPEAATISTTALSGSICPGDIIAVSDGRNPITRLFKPAYNYRVRSVDDECTMKTEPVEIPFSEKLSDAGWYLVEVSVDGLLEGLDYLPLMISALAFGIFVGNYFDL